MAADVFGASCISFNSAGTKVSVAYENLFQPHEKAIFFKSIESNLYLSRFPKI